MDENSINYNPDANTDDGSCIPIVEGCIDPDSFNYDPNANVDDGSCVPVVYGCMDPDSFNYNPDANTDNGTCEAVALWGSFRMYGSNLRKLQPLGYYR
jgi:hypothetical protein